MIGLLNCLPAVAIKVCSIVSIRRADDWAFEPSETVPVVRKLSTVSIRRADDWAFERRYSYSPSGSLTVSIRRADDWAFERRPAGPYSGRYRRFNPPGG